MGGPKMPKKRFEFTIRYYKPSGKLYTTETFCSVTNAIALPDETFQPYMPDMKARIIGWRDKGGPARLPGLSCDGWEGPILLDCEDAYSVLILPDLPADFDDLVSMFTKMPDEWYPKLLKEIIRLGEAKGVWKPGEAVQCIKDAAEWMRLSS